MSSDDVKQGDPPSSPVGDRCLAMPESSDSPARQSGDHFTPMGDGQYEFAAQAGNGNELQSKGGEGDPEDAGLPHGGGPMMVPALVLAIFLAFAAYLALFSEIGFGATLFKALMAAAKFYVPVAGLGFIVLVIFYIVDFDMGHAVLNYIVCTLVACCMVFAAVLCFSSMPHAPLMAFMVTTTAYFAAVYISFYSKSISPEGYVKALSKACLIGGVAGFIASCVWAAINFCWWGTDCKLKFRNSLRVCSNMAIGDGSNMTIGDGIFCERYGTFGTTCRKGCTEVPALSACDPDEEHCLAAFMLWASPFLMSVLMVIFGAAMHLISGTAMETKNGGTSLASNRKFKIFGHAMLFLIMLLWLGASIAGASMQLSNVIVSFAFLGLLMTAAIMAVTFGGRKMQSTMKDIKIIKTMTQDPFYSDLGRGLAIFVGGPIFLLFLPIAFLKRSIRKCRAGPDNEPAGDVESAQVPTQKSRKPFREVAAFQLIEDSKSWRWTSILRFTWIWGFAFFAMQALVMTMTTMFMAWLNMQLAGLHVGLICVIIICIALVLFAIPVVPGVPAYLACGVIIGAAEKQIGSFELTLLVAWLVAGVSKQLACLMQQKIFGVLLGKSLWVRSTLGVNQPVMKAINLILQEPGLTPAKVAILVGGPDWPTSVLTGVLNLKAYQMQIGTLPVLIPILFIVLTGAAMLKTGQDPDSLWVPLSAVFLTLSGMLQVGIALMAVKYTNQVTKERAAEIAAMPNDAEVEKFDASQKKAIQEKDAVMKWEEQSSLWRLVLASSIVSIVISGWIFKMFTCFEDVVLTSNIDLPPFNGRFLNVFKFYGWVGLCFQVFSWVLYYMFTLHINSKVKSNRKLSRVDQEPDVHVEQTAASSMPASTHGAPLADRAQTALVDIPEQNVP